MKQPKISYPLAKSISYIITFTTNILPLTVSKEIYNFKAVANMRFKEISKKYFYAEMVKETTTREIIKKVSSGHS